MSQEQVIEHRARARSARASLVSLVIGGALALALAAEASTGCTTLWVKRYNGPTNGRDYADSVVVSPDGSTVFVTGRSHGAETSYDYATVAYAA